MSPEQITHITRAYAFGDADKAMLTETLASAYLHAKQQAYRRAHSTAGKHVTLSLWQPGKDDQDKAHEWAVPRAQGIAETYESLLRSQLEQMEESAVQEGIGDVWQGIKDVVGQIGDWFKGLMGWKPDQIAQNTWNEGDNDGTEQFIEDVVSSGTDYSMMEVRVDPEESSSDFCADYAGKSFAFDDIGSDACPNFPAHGGCIHYLTVYIINENGEEEEVPM